jgi:SAM-dependent methyltransferase
VGAQTISLARRSPGAKVTAVDLSATSLEVARRRVTEAGIPGILFREADLHRLPFADASFDHVFICFVLEHIRDPVHALQELRRVLKPTGTLTVIEGDHGSFLFHPRTQASLEAWSCLVQTQARLGGDALIGRRLYPLLRDARFEVRVVSPRVVYADARTPGLVDVFARKIIAGMVEGVRDLLREDTPVARFEEGLAHLRRLADSPEATVCYTFFKALAFVPETSSE